MNIKVRDSKYGQDFLRSSFGGSLGLGLWCLRSPKGLGVHAPKRKKSIPPPNGIRPNVARSFIKGLFIKGLPTKGSPTKAKARCEDVVDISE